MVYQAPLLAGGLGLIFVWRDVCLRISKKHKDNHEKTGLLFSVLQYYTPLYLGMGYLCIVAIKTSIDLLRREGNFFNTAEDQLRIAQAGDPNLPVEQFRQETAFLHDSWSWLPIYLSLASIPALIGTFICGLMHTISHAKEVHKKGLHLDMLPKHDKAMQIVALPMIYGLMAFKSMMRMWQVCMNDQHEHALRELDSWNARTGFLNQMYEANFSVADLYEAWALYHFASLAVEVVKEKAEDANLNMPVLISAIQNLTSQGIWGFIFCCLLNSAYTLILTSGEFYGSDGEGGTAESFRSATESGENVYGFPSQIKGAGFLASSLAIMNVVKIELGFHHELTLFSPGLKFLSTKVLVSLAFMQSLILSVPPFSGWSPTGQNMFYASLLCVECFFVALLHVKAWPAKEDWYHDEEVKRASIVELIHKSSSANLKKENSQNSG